MNYLIDSRQSESEQIFVPCFERLGHYRMVGIGNDPRNIVPGFVPGETVFVYEYAHELGDAECRVCIIYMDRNLVRKIFERSVYRDMVSYYALNRCRNEKILLGKPQKFSLVMII